MKKQLALLTGPLAVALWVAGAVTVWGLTGNVADNASDAAVLAWVQGNKNTIILGSWLFMAGCAAFICFAGVLRSRLAEAEGGLHTAANTAFGAAIAFAALAMASQSDMATAINADSVSPAAAGALHHIGDLGFMGAELAAVALLASTCVLAFKTAVVPRWWGVLSAIVAVVLVIGPIGWAALIFGLPVWTVVTSLLLARGPRQRLAVSAATA
jgi:hypothetical protein